MSCILFKFIMNWPTLKAEIRFKFKFPIQFTENLAKFVTEIVFALYQHQGSRSKTYPPFEFRRRHMQT